MSEPVLSCENLKKTYQGPAPVHVLLGDVTTIGLVSLVLSFVATLYPSWRASKTNPAEALRYE